MTRRALGSALLLTLCVGLAVPLSLGWWAPAWLQVAKVIEVDVRVASTVKFSPVDDAFSVAQTSSGKVLWRLTGARLALPDGLYHQRVDEPRLVVRPPGQPELELTARLAEVELPRDRKGEQPGSDYLIVDLTGEVVLRRGDLRCTTEALQLRVHRKPEGRAKADGVQLTTPGPVVVTGRPPAKPGKPAPAAWTLEAAALAVTGSPWRAELRAPVRLRSTELAAPELLAGQALQIEAAGGATIVDVGSASRADRPPEALQLVARDVRFRGRGETGGQAEQLTLRYGRLPASAQAALGGLAGLHEAWSYGLTGLEARRLTGRLTRPARPAAGKARRRAALDLELAGEALSLERGTARRAVLRGAPARIVDRTAGQSLRGEVLIVTERSDGAQELEARGDVAFAVVQPAQERRGRRPAPRRARPPVRWTGRAPALRARLAPVASVAHLSTAVRPLRRVRALSAARLDLRASDGTALALRGLRYAAQGPAGQLRVDGGLRGTLGAVERGRRARPWRVAADRTSAELDLAAIAAVRSDRAARGPAALRRVLRRADLRGGVVLERDTPAARPERARGLRGDRVVYADGVVRARGAAALTIGRSRLEAPSVRYAVQTGRIEAGPRVTWTTSLPPRKARRGRPASPQAPLVLRAATAVGTLRSEPARWRADQAQRRAERRAGLPGWRVPAALERLEVVGRPLTLTGPDALRLRAGTLRYADGTATLTSHGDAAVVASSTRGGLRARRVRLTREAPLAPLLPGRTWLAADGDVEARIARKRSPLQLRAAWVRAELLDPGPSAPRGKRPRPGLGLFAAGGGVDLRVTPSARAKPGKRAKPPRRLALQTQRIAGDGARRLPDGRPGLLLEVPGRWTTTVTLPKKGPARVVAGRATAWIDLEAASGGRGELETEEAFVRRLLAGLDARDGVELIGAELSARGERASLDGQRGVYVLRGDPVVVRREGVEQRVPEWILRLQDE